MAGTSVTKVGIELPINFWGSGGNSTVEEDSVVDGDSVVDFTVEVNSVWNEMYWAPLCEEIDQNNQWFYPG